MDGSRDGLVVVERHKLAGLVACFSPGYRGRYLWGNLRHWRCGAALRRGRLGSCWHDNCIACSLRGEREMFRLLSSAVCATSALLAIGASFILGCGVACALREVQPPSTEGTRSTRRAARGKAARTSG